MVAQLRGNERSAYSRNQFHISISSFGHFTDLLVMADLNLIYYYNSVFLVYLKFLEICSPVPGIGQI